MCGLEGSETEDGTMSPRGAVGVDAASHRISGNLDGFIRYVHNPKRSTGSDFAMAFALLRAMDEGRRRPPDVSSGSSSPSSGVGGGTGNFGFGTAIDLFTAKLCFLSEVATGSFRLGGGSIPSKDDLHLISSY